MTYKRIVSITDPAIAGALAADARHAAVWLVANWPNR